MDTCDCSALQWYVSQIALLCLLYLSVDKCKKAELGDQVWYVSHHTPINLPVCEYYPCEILQTGVSLSRCSCKFSFWFSCAASYLWCRLLITFHSGLRRHLECTHSSTGAQSATFTFLQRNQLLHSVANNGVRDAYSTADITNCH